jgi:hypothetical protein
MLPIHKNKKHNSNNNNNNITNNNNKSQLRIRLSNRRKKVKVDQTSKRKTLLLLELMISMQMHEVLVIFLLEKMSLEPILDKVVNFSMASKLILRTNKRTLVVKVIKINSKFHIISSKSLQIMLLTP